jgi:ABC-type lipoprotein export system ATPase subunit
MTTDAILELDAVNKRFGGLAVVDGLSFSVRRGSVTGLIGPNGAGKTTIFNLITGLYPVDGGRIVLNGRDITDVPARHRIRYGVARSFQNIRLMPHLTVVENILLGQHCRNFGLCGVLQPLSLFPRNRWREEAREALFEAGLAGYERATAADLPYGIQKGVELVRAQWNSMDWTAARRGYITQTVLRKGPEWQGPEWLLLGKAAADADMLGRLSVTRSCHRLCIAASETLQTSNSRPAATGRRDSGNAGPNHSPLMVATFMIGHYFSTSAFLEAASASGVCR